MVGDYIYCISDGPLKKNKILENALVLQNLEALDVSLPKNQQMLLWMLSALIVDIKLRSMRPKFDSHFEVLCRSLSTQCFPVISLLSYLNKKAQKPIQ